jgi:hypothetical protein
MTNWQQILPLADLPISRSDLKLVCQSAITVQLPASIGFDSYTDRRTDRQTDRQTRQQQNTNK